MRQAIEDINSVKEELRKQRKNNKMQAVYRSIGGSNSPRLDVSTIENNVVGYNIEQELCINLLETHLYCWDGRHRQVNFCQKNVF